MILHNCSVIQFKSKSLWACPIQRDWCWAWSVKASIKQQEAYGSGTVRMGLVVGGCDGGWRQ